MIQGLPTEQNLLGKDYKSRAIFLFYFFCQNINNYAIKNQLFTKQLLQLKFWITYLLENKTISFLDLQMFKYGVYYIVEQKRTNS